MPLTESLSALKRLWRNNEDPLISSEILGPSVTDNADTLKRFVETHLFYRRDPNTKQPKQANAALAIYRCRLKEATFRLAYTELKANTSSSRTP